MRQHGIKIILFLISVLPNRNFAQQTALSEMYLVDYFYANPAEAGRKNCLITRISDLHQWIGISNAPNIQSIAIQKGFKKEHKESFHGIGGILIHDQNGRYKSTAIKAVYAYHILISDYKKTYLSFGLAGQYSQRTFDEGGLLNYNSDPALSGGHSAWSPNADFGIMLTRINFVSGIAILDILPPSGSLSEQVPAELRNRKYSFFIGKSYSLAHYIDAEPSITFKTNESFFKQVDLNTKVYFGELFWLGLSYRHDLDALPGKPLSGLIYAGIIINKWSVDYSFTYNLSSFQKYHYGSHGLTISYTICTKEKGAIPCPVFNSRH